MNRLKNYVLMAVGFAVLVVVVGVFSAGPAIAQAVRAALVSNVDDPGRIPYQFDLQVQGGDCSHFCTQITPLVPAGKRLVLTSISGSLATTVPGGTQLLVGIDPGFNTGTLTLILPTTGQGVAGGVSYFGFNQSVLTVYNGPGNGPSPSILMGVAGLTRAQFHLSGYLLDCTTGPCAAIAP